MIDNIIQWSLSNRLLVIVFSALVVIWGSVEASNMPVDVFPDLTAPTVTVVTEAHGLTPDDVERMIATPIESSLNGATKVRRVRSVIAEGIAIVKVDFDWGVPLLSARQVVSERLQLASPLLPEEADTPIIGPMTSVMGEILFLGLTTERDDIDRMELGSIAKWNVARRLLAVPGVAQVMPLGGDTKQYQVRLDPYKLNALGLRAEDVAGALEQASENMPAGFMREGGTEKLIVGIGRIQTVDDIAESYITTRGETPILVKDVAQVHIGPAIRRGDGGINQRPGVVIGIRKQPDVNTLALTTDLERALAQINQGLPEGVVLHTDLFRQADFISLAIENVTAA
ncbi:MAG: efflux RND transporter permease subunit, partial [Myxococcota bacterium]|nr:efflux RND transporter permease subunit [Myxococcota bacterium]